MSQTPHCKDCHRFVEKAGKLLAYCDEAFPEFKPCELYAVEVTTKPKKPNMIPMVPVTGTQFRLATSTAHSSLVELNSHFPHQLDLLVEGQITEVYCQDKVNPIEWIEFDTVDTLDHQSIQMLINVVSPIIEAVSIKLGRQFLALSFRLIRATSE